MNFNRNSSQEHTAGFQMAPMMDVIFLLLLFWMVTSIYAQWERNIDLTVPTAETGTQELRQIGELIVNVAEDGSISISGISTDASGLRDTLNQLSNLHPNHPVIVRADAKADFQFVMTVLDICRQSKVYNVSFASLPAAAVKDGDTQP